MEDIDKKIWDMLDILPEVEPSNDFETRLFKRIEEIESKENTFIEKIRRLIFIPVPAAAVIGLLLGIIIGSISIKDKVKEPSILANLENFSSFPQNLLANSYMSLTKSEGGR